MSIRKNLVKTLLVTSSVSFVILSIFAEACSSKSIYRRSFRSSAMLHIVNGSFSLVQENRDGFVYCYSNVMTHGRSAHLKVVWTDPTGKPLTPYSKVDVRRQKIFSVQQDFKRPNSYLVFRSFDKNMEGKYSCNLVYHGRIMMLQTIHLKLFRPTFRVVPLPKCVTVRDGGTLMIPSPVVGRPESPPYWSRIGGGRDLSTAIQLPTGLLLQRVHESAVYRAVARLGGGLVHQQDVTVTVLLHDGTAKELRNKPRVATTAPSKCLRGPVAATPSPTIALANKLIAEMQMASCCNPSEEETEE